MDPFHLCLALGPVAVYLLLIGAIHVSRRPLVVSGARDAAALGLAVAGLIAVGPIELFFPYAAAAQFGAYVWIFLITFYSLCLVLILLLMRPRIIVYNVTIERLRPILADLVQQLDGDARWAGDGLILPNMGVQAHLEIFPALRNVSLVATGPRQNYLGWRRLETALHGAIVQSEVVQTSPGDWRLGAALLAAGLLIGAVILQGVARDPQSVAQSLFEMLRLPQ